MDFLVSLREKDFFDFLELSDNLSASHLVSLEFTVEFLV